MAKGELQINGDPNAAMQAFVGAVTYMGGSVTSMNPARPVEFSVRRTGSMMGGMGAPYGGTATFVPTANGQTRVLIELKPKAWYTAIFVLIALGVLGVAGAVGGEDDATIMAVAAIAAIAVAGTLYLYYVPWPQQVIEKLQQGVHGTVPAYESNPAARGPQPAVAAAAAASPSQAQGGIAEQLGQLSDLHKKGLITDAEFESKKADLLSRL